MRNVTKVILGIVGVAVLLIGWWLISPIFLDETVDEGLPPTSLDATVDEEGEAEEATEPSSSEDDGTAKEFADLAGVFMDGEKNYETSGNIQTIRAEDGVYLRFEDFKTTNGPDLFVYLIQPEMETTEGIRLGALKGNTGNQNYLIPEDVDFTQYTTVVIWCRAFDATFGTGELSPQ